MKQEFFNQPIQQSDPLVADILSREAQRQIDQIELIASENIVSQAVMDALGGHITNKTVEGYPGKRYHGGAKIVDEVEQLAIDRACELFGAAYANVQPHSGSQANLAVFTALLKPGDTVLSMALSAGGHLSHGANPNLSGKWFNIVHYGVHEETGQINYEEMASLAKEHRPKLLIAGGSAYPRVIDFARMAEIAKSVGATFLVDMAHIAGLVAGGAHPNPIPHADIVTCTVTKTLRGPRGGMILTRDASWRKKLNSAVFPGSQGSIHLNVIAAKAVCLGEALRPEFKTYAAQVVKNGRALAATLQEEGFEILSGGTDNHLMLVDTSSAGLTGDQAEKVIELAGLTCNKNAMPGDPVSTMKWRGVRLGVSAVTTRGMKEAEMVQCGRLLARIWKAADGYELDAQVAAESQAAVAKLCRQFPTYSL
ncbi:MAG: glycine hydroxymethyltransferase [Candidatus Promineifilaceae bacterium]|jgi:glycine hydroxymethyltransferase